MQRIVDRLAKWKMHRFYSKHPKISQYLPSTAKLTKDSLENYIRLYRTVYVKANTIHTGRAIVKVWPTHNGYHFVRVRGKVQHADSASHLINKVREIDAKDLFLVQEAIDVAEMNGHPYDIRVMMMRDGARNWQFAGMVAKVNGSGSVVSNVRRGGGFVLPVATALAKSGFAPVEVRRIRNELITLSKQIIKYSEKYPFFSYQCGIDLAVDKAGKPWIIEVNLHNPSHGLFKQLKDQTYYKRVRKLYRDYRQHNSRLI
ncbi:YheC/YheD family protein [Alicyclobacillus sp. ALC3]|uniref:YheC/YheD family protein n=1 Tax=Alicyclobacillus sp. ALC3 TaxID=2796143 RepID=UPI0023785845|nr:YheC/YheD family protein [Alicyclobacillus sp. ALC3]WDL95728.1 YheC/YheD family protein [Alicyclobacillus sp. ALC3]